MMNLLSKLFSPKQNQSSNYKIQSFTFFIPSPPARNSGYREKQFDKLFYDFINRGYEILSFNTQVCSGPSQSGMWIVCVVRALNEEADRLSLDDIFHDQIKNSSTVKEEVEGLYYIKDISSEEV
jgi:hypothetical protein